MGELNLWSQHRSYTSRYSRRRPEETALYQIIYNYEQELQNHWDELFQEKYGALRPCVVKAMDEYQSCGILRFGCARAYCKCCMHSELIAFSCKKRGICASCAAKRSILFAENLHENVLLDQEHRHLVFTIPKRLRPYFMFDRSLLSILHKSAWLAWKQYLNSIIPDSTPAMVSAIHTAGSFLEFHPHIHAIALNGALDKDSNLIPLTSIDTNKLEALFQKNIFEALHTKELLSEDTIVNMATWEHSGFSVFAGEAFNNKDQRLFLARYLKKPPVALSSLKLENNELDTTVTITKQLDDGEHSVSFSPLEFLAKLQQHIPNTWEQSVRYFGAYSARTRGAKKIRKTQTEQDPNSIQPIIPLTSDDQSPDSDKTPTSSTWARCIKKIYEVDPLLCPKCGEQMKIIAFIHNETEIQKIADHLGVITWTKPPPITKTSTTYDYSD